LVEQQSELPFSDEVSCELTESYNKKAEEIERIKRVS